MKLLDFIFAKPKKQEEKPKWTIENNGWEQSANNYDAFVNYMRGQE